MVSSYALSSTVWPQAQKKAAPPPKVRVQQKQQQQVSEVVSELNHAISDHIGGQIQPKMRMQAHQQQREIGPLVQKFSTFQWLILLALTIVIISLHRLAIFFGQLSLQLTVISLQLPNWQRH